MPPKQLNGPVGEFQTIMYDLHYKIPLKRNGLWLLLVEAIDRYYFDNGRNESFDCPLPNCEACFDRAGAWTVHAIEVHNQDQ